MENIKLKNIKITELKEILKKYNKEKDIQSIKTDYVNNSVDFKFKDGSIFGIRIIQLENELKEFSNDIESDELIYNISYDDTSDFVRIITVADNNNYNFKNKEELENIFIKNLMLFRFPDYTILKTELIVIENDLININSIKIQCEEKNKIKPIKILKMIAYAETSFIIKLMQRINII